MLQSIPCSREVNWQLVHFLLFPNRDNYIGQKLREDAFDPKGKGTFTALDDLVKTQQKQPMLK